METSTVVEVVEVEGGGAWSARVVRSRVLRRVARHIPQDHMLMLYCFVVDVIEGGKMANSQTSKKLGYFGLLGTLFS